MVTRASSPFFDVSNQTSLGDAVARSEVPDTPCAACNVRHLTVCHALAPDELHHLASIVSNIELEPGDPLFDEGEEAVSVFNVTAGTVKIYKLLPDGRRQVTGFLFPGDFLGLANSAIYAFSAEAVTPATVCRFPRKKLEALMERFPEVERQLLGRATHELAVAQEQMLLLGRKTAKERIASFLLMLSRAALRRGQKENPVTVPMSRTDIGDYLGLTTETVSRTFTQLKKSGMIVLQTGGRVELAQKAALEDLAEGFSA